MAEKIKNTLSKKPKSVVKIKQKPKQAETKTDVLCKIVNIQKSTCLSLSKIKLKELRNQLPPNQDITKRQKTITELQAIIDAISSKVTFPVISDKNSNLITEKERYIREVWIRKKYWEKITWLFQKYVSWSIVDENMLWAIIAKESRFDTKAISYKWVDWLCQISNDTVDTILNINAARNKKDSNKEELFIERKSLESKRYNKKKKKFELDEKKVLDPLVQMKLAISYLLFLEKLFELVPIKTLKEKEFKKDLMVTAYNLGPTKTKEIYDKYKWINDWNWLKKALEEASDDWLIKERKKDEVVSYVPEVKDNRIRLASLN